MFAASLLRAATLPTAATWGRALSSHAQDTNTYIQQALKELSLPARFETLLMTPRREVSCTLTILKDNNEIASFEAYRVQHDNARGPYKGGIRFHPQCDLDDVSTFHLSLSLSRHWTDPSLPFSLSPPRCAPSLP